MNPGTADSELNETPIPPPRSLLRLALPSAGITLLMLAATYWVRMRIPAGTRVPMHWNAAGQVDGYGDRNTLFLLPGITVLLAVILALVPRFDPRGRNILMSGKAYGMVWFSVTLFLGVIQGAMLLTAMGHPVSIMRVIIPATGLLFLVLGNYLGKVRSNFFFGVRTPWTLSSELSWNKTHRLTGWLFVGLGLILLPVGFAKNPGASAFWLMEGGVLLLVVVSFAYSYLVWRKDPHKSALGCAPVHPKDSK